tara:strand:+ start:332 stop:907 length:576 start_codon:yes stop_codon:yes gene_type:complete
LKNSNKILDETPFQTAGPFLHIGCMPNKIKINKVYENDLGEIPFKNKSESELITIEGSVFDGNGIALDDVMLESWQCDQYGQFIEDNGFARFMPDDSTKKFKLTTVKPGSIKDFEGKTHSPYISLSISSRGLNMTLNTRVYFDDDNLKSDPLLSILKINHRNSLIAKKIKKNKYLFDIFLQGEKETIFLDI